MMQIRKLDSLKTVLNEFLEILNSDMNNKRKSYWSESFNDGIDQWRAVPNSKAIPFVIDLQIDLWAHLLNFNILDYYQNPFDYLYNYLRICIARYKMFEDYYFLIPYVRIDFGSPFVPSLIGSEVIFSNDRVPFARTDAVINSKDDLKKLRGSKNFEDGFTNEGLMLLANKFNAEIRELLIKCGYNTEIELVFPLWRWGLFNLAVHLVGYEKILIDMLIEPDFTHSVMRFITDARKRWYIKVFGKEDYKRIGGYLYNDYISCPELSPALYKEFILPYEIELYNFHNGIKYWHSCGNISKLIPAIAEIPAIEMFHVGPWTSVDEASNVFGKRSALEVCLNIEEDVLRTTEYGMRKKLTDIKNSCLKYDVKQYAVRAGGFMYDSSLSESIEPIKKWNRVAKDIFGYKMGGGN